MPMLQKLLQHTENVGTPPNSFLKASITLLPKPERDFTRKEGEN